MGKIADEIDREYRIRMAYQRLKRKNRICKLDCNNCILKNNCSISNAEKVSDSS